MNATAARWQAADIAGVLLLGVLQLPTPFHGDQALFAVGGARLLDGAVLYRDFWDVKQPGVFAFYAAGRALLGADEVAVHALELAWIAALAVAIAAATRRRLGSRAALALAPLWGAGLYYATAQPWHLTQVEALAGLPLFLAAWLAASPPRNSPGRSARPDRPGPARFAAAGLAGAAAVLLKLFFLPIVLAVWAVTLFRHPARARAAAALLTGFLLPLTAVVLAFAASGALDEAAWTTFVVPSRVASEAPLSALPRLGEAVAWFTVFFGPVLVLAALGVRGALRRRDTFGLQLVAWLATGVLVILAQAGSWWGYHGFLLAVPCGVLAAWGLDDLLQGPPAVALHRARRAEDSGDLADAPTGRGRRRAKAALALLLVLGSVPALARTGRRVGLLAANDWALTSEGLASYRDAVDPDYAVQRRDVRFLNEPGSLPGPIHAIGNPLQLHLARRAQAVSVHGWVPWRLLPEQWRRMASELADARPAYVLVEHEFRTMVARRSPEMVRVLERLYVPLRTTSRGVWYVRSAPRDSTSPPSAAWRRIPAT